MRRGVIAWAQSLSDHPCLWATCSKVHRNASILLSLVIMLRRCWVSWAGFLGDAVGQGSGQGTLQLPLCLMPAFYSKVNSFRWALDTDTGGSSLVQRKVLFKVLFETLIKVGV